MNKPEIDITINPEDIKEAVGDQLDRITETFYQNTDPSILWGDDDKALHEGDFWKCSEVTGDGKPKGSEWQYQKISEDEYVWIRVDIFNEVFDEIDGKSTIYTTMDNSTSTTMPAESEI